MDDRALEFDCCECGCHVVIFVPPLPEPRLCAHCLFLPGWPDVPELARIINRPEDEGVGEE